MAGRGDSPSRAWLRALDTTARATRDPQRILPRAVAEWALRYGDATALVSDRETFSFRALEARMNQYSRWALGADVAKGETIALSMGNRPEYFAIWLGLTQVGAIVALVSADLRGPVLAHALKVAEARRLIVDANGAEAIAGLAALSLLPQTWKVIWAPIIDTTLTIKRWFLLSAVAIGVLMIATAIVPPTAANLILIEALVMGFSMASSFNAMAADSLMAHATPPDEKGRAGGWSQAGNLGGSGLGGGADSWRARSGSGRRDPGCRRIRR